LTLIQNADIWGNYSADFVDLGLESPLGVKLFFTNLTFKLFSLLVLKYTLVTFGLSFVLAWWVGCTDNFRSQIYFWLESVLFLVFRTTLCLLSQEILLATLKIFKVDRFNRSWRL